MFGRARDAFRGPRSGGYSTTAPMRSGAVAFDGHTRPAARVDDLAGAQEVVHLQANRRIAAWGFVRVVRGAVGQVLDGWRGHTAVPLEQPGARVRGGRDRRDEAVGR